MAAARRVRWECPAGKHPAVLGPTKPRRDNIVRYCLPCSQATGKLTERVAPTVERRREAAAERAAAKRKAKATRDKAREDAYYTVAGEDLRVLYKRLARHVGEHGKLARRRMPRLVITRRRSVPSSRYGAASPYEWTIWISDYPGIDRADVTETLLHEMVHLYVGGDPNDKRRWHGKQFHRTFREAFSSAFPHARVYGDGAPTAYHGGYARALRDLWATPEQNRTVAARREETANEIEQEIANGASKDDFVSPAWFRGYAATLRRLAEEKETRIARRSS